MRILVAALLGSCALLLAFGHEAASARPGSTQAADPVLGTWRVTSGGSGTFVIVANTGTDYYRMTATTPLTILCAHAATGDTIGITYRAGSFSKPKGQYVGAVTNNGTDCQETINFSLSGDTISGHDIGTGKTNETFTFVRAGSTTPPPSGKLTIRWAMQNRFGVDRNGDHLIDYLTTKQQIDPPGYTVDVLLSAGGGCPSGNAVFAVGGKRVPSAAAPGVACGYFVEFPKQGKQKLTVELAGPSGTAKGATDVEVRDFLIAGLGDSNGSGEGSPDIPGTSPTWEHLRCDRSANSFEAQAALLVSRRDPAKASVTFVHLACSGASMPKGLLGPYPGINDPGGPPLASQLSQLAELKGKRELDALLLSIGVNDIDFSPLVSFCLAQDACMNQPYPNASSKETLSAATAHKLAALPGLYARLNDRLAALHIPAGRVYITEYPDSTHDARGAFCNPLISVPGKGTFDQAEAAWAFQHVLTPLNKAVAAAAGKFHWHLLSGVGQAFAAHGYCSSDPWIVGLTESLANEGTTYGTLHANAVGQRSVAALLYRQLAPALFPGGKPRQP